MAKGKGMWKDGLKRRVDGKPGKTRIVKNKQKKLGAYA